MTEPDKSIGSEPGAQSLVWLVVVGTVVTTAVGLALFYFFAYIQTGETCAQPARGPTRRGRSS